MILAPLLDPQGKYPVTCKANAKRNSTTGGSVIDFAFLTLQLYENLFGSRYEFESELSSHAWIELSISTEAAPVPEATTESYPARTVMQFDFDCLLQLAHTDSLVALATSPGELTVQEAYDTMLDFVSMFTTTRLVTGTGQARRLSARRHLRRIRQRMRRIERKMRKSRDPAITKVLEEQLKSTIDMSGTFSKKNRKLEHENSLLSRKPVGT